MTLRTTFCFTFHWRNKYYKEKWNPVMVQYIKVKALTELIFGRTASLSYVSVWNHLISSVLYTCMHSEKHLSNIFSSTCVQQALIKRNENIRYENIEGTCIWCSPLCWWQLWDRWAEENARGSNAGVRYTPTERTWGWRYEWIILRGCTSPAQCHLVCMKRERTSILLKMSIWTFTDISIVCVFQQLHSESWKSQHSSGSLKLTLLVKFSSF